MCGMSVDGGLSVLDADLLLDSCDYAVGGYCGAAAGPAYYASASDDAEYHRSLSSAAGSGFAPVDMTDVCDMCGQLLPPDEHLRHKHIQVLV